MRGRMVKSSEATAFIKIAQQLAMIARYKPLQGNVSVSIYLHPKTKKDGTASDIRLDLDNCLKVAIDSMNGIAYNDDKQIIRLFAEIGQPMPNGGLTVIWEDA
jgi:crossover junction endodeoxyribonuclease RusA